MSRSSVQTSTITEETTVTQPVSEPSSDQVAPPATTERKSLKPRRSQVTYSARSIETLSQPQRNTAQQESSGLMFVPDGTECCGAFFFGGEIIISRGILYGSFSKRNGLLLLKTFSSVSKRVKLSFPSL